MYKPKSSLFGYFSLKKLPYPLAFQGTVRLSKYLNRCEYLSLHRDDPITDHIDLSGRHHTQVKDTPLGIRAPVIDPDNNALAIL